MYEAYWQLERRPFENTSDEAFYYPSEVHQGALLKLRYTVEHRRGAALLAGEHGSGKTQLLEMLKHKLGEHCRPLAHVVFPQLSPADLLAYLADELAPAGPETPRTEEQSVRRIQRFLAANTERGGHAVLAIDEAHLIKDPTCWEALRLLLNFQSAGRGDLTLLLVGQLPLLTTMDRMVSWEERLAVKCLLRPLTSSETACYMQHRLEQAGCQRDPFTSAAVEAIHRLSGGLPRRINRLADLALVIGYAEELDRIDTPEIEAVCGELITVTPGY